MTDAVATITDPYRRNLAPKQASQDGAFGFQDLLDVVNPLQHIPGLNLLYREVTGDTIKPPAAIAGGALFGGALGFAGALLSAAFEDLTGDGPLDTLVRGIAPRPHGVASNAYAQTSALAKDQIQR
jgi:hypothetical protein